MSALWSTLTTGAARWAALAAMAVLAVLGLWRMAERAGRRAADLEGEEARNAALTRMLEAGARRPRNRSAVARRLRSGDF